MTDGNILHLPRIRMGDAGRLFGLTARAIRLDEEKGLIAARRDRCNCRYFDDAARRRLGWISALRAAGLPLADIGRALDAEDRDGSGRDFAAAKLNARRAELQLQLAKLDLVAKRLGQDDFLVMPARDTGKA